MWLNSYSAELRLMTSCISAMTLPKRILRTKSDVPFLSLLSISMSLISLFSSLLKAYLISEQHLLMLDTVENMHFPLSMSLT